MKEYEIFCRHQLPVTLELDFIIIIIVIIIIIIIHRAIQS